MPAKKLEITKPNIIRAPADAPSNLISAAALPVSDGAASVAPDGERDAVLAVSSDEVEDVEVRVPEICVVEVELLVMEVDGVVELLAGVVRPRLAKR